MATATVVSAAVSVCGSAMRVGQTRKDVHWRIAIDGESIALDVDMSNWPTDHTPYSGSVTGRQFAASYAVGSNYLDFFCQYKGGTLSGSFSTDLSSFEAIETSVWGPPGGEMTVQSRWSGSKLE